MGVTDGRGMALPQAVGRVLFLHGAEMEPERVLARWPEARFLARAHLQPRPAGAVPPPVDSRYQTWGIVIETPAATDVGEAWEAVTDDGRAVAAVVLAPDNDDSVAVLAAARYWELPPAYVRRLAQAAAVPVEDYFY